MNGVNIGDRVLAISHQDENGVHVFGEGKFLGAIVPREDAVGMARVIREQGRTNPAIELDSGAVVYGCECWWSPVDVANAKIGNTKRIPADIEERRKEAREREAAIDAMRKGKEGFEQRVLSAQLRIAGMLSTIIVESEKDASGSVFGQIDAADREQLAKDVELVTDFVTLVIESTPPETSLQLVMKHLGADYARVFAEEHGIETQAPEEATSRG